MQAITIAIVSCLLSDILHGKSHNNVSFPRLGKKERYIIDVTIQLADDSQLCYKLTHLVSKYLPKHM